MSQTVSQEEDGWWKVRSEVRCVAIFNTEALALRFAEALDERAAGASA